MPSFNGTNGRDTLLGTAFADNINGLDGDDVIRGFDGNDNLRDGYGNDRAFGNEGNDYFATPAGRDSLFGGTGDDFFQVVQQVGSRAGPADRIAPTLFDGGVGTDKVSFFRVAENQRVHVDLANNSKNSNGAEGDTFVGIENVSGTYRGDTLRGDREDNVLEGQDGNDIIDGRGGDNTLFGGLANDRLYVDGGDDALFGGRGSDRLFARDGDDTLAGGVGADLIDGGLGRDLVNYSDSSEANAAVSADLQKSQNMGGIAEGDTLRGIEDLVGTDFDDYLGGNSDANMLSGSYGNDTIDGRAGEDTLFGGNGNDRLIADNEDDLFFGGAGDDTLISRGGDDTLVGGNGDDKFFGGSGSDTFAYGANDGNDRIMDFDLAEDVLLIQGITFGTGPGETDPSSFLTTVGSIEGRDAVLDLDGSTSVRLVNVFDNPSTASLSDLVPSLVGTGSSDPFNTSDDISEGDIVGTSANDNLSAPFLIMDANDPVVETSLFGLAGDDTLAGSGSNDTFTGGSGDDVFLIPLDDTYGSLPGDDVITDFEIGSDQVQIEGGFPTDEAGIRNLLSSEATIENGTDLLLMLTAPLNQQGTLLLENIVDASIGDEAEDYWEAFV